MLGALGLLKIQRYQRTCATAWTNWLLHKLSIKQAAASHLITLSVFSSTCSWVSLYMAMLFRWMTMDKVQLASALYRAVSTINWKWVGTYIRAIVILSH